VVVLGSIRLDEGIQLSIVIEQVSNNVQLAWSIV
jgi:hypothetical protein